ncbi:hypothetical protein LZ269_36185 [Streptomyces lomondensis]|nr:hypothetical protein [Streptomyces lomondensis]MCF0082754.1 hypothetical protein [Streptomyces lomondensis]
MRRQDTLHDNQPRPNRLDRHKSHLDRRFTEGCTSVTQLHPELVAQVAPLAYGMVRASIATLRAVPPDGPPPPSARRTERA